MAAAQRGKVKVQTKRRQKAQQDKPQAAPKQGKCQPQPGPQMRQKPVVKQLKSCQGKKALGKNGASAHYASKMLRQMRKVRMSAKAKGLMKSFMADLYSQVSTEAKHLRKQKQLPTLGSSVVRAALQQVMPREVAKHSATPVCNESAQRTIPPFSPRGKPGWAERKNKRGEREANTSLRDPNTCVIENCWKHV